MSRATRPATHLHDGVFHDGARGTLGALELEIGLGQKKKPSFELRGSDRPHLLRQLARLERGSPRASRSLLGARSGPHRRGELDELTHRPGQDADEAQPAITRVVY